MACLPVQEVLRVSIHQDLQVVVEIATKYSETLGPATPVEIFEGFKSFEGTSIASFISFFSSTYVFDRSLLIPGLCHQPE